MCEILPYVEQDGIAKQMFPWPSNFFTIYKQGIKLYICPADTRSIEGLNPLAGNAGATDYLGVTGNNTVPYWDRGPTNGFFNVVTFGDNVLSITDGTSNTLAVGERPPADDMYWGWWSVSDFDCLLSTQNPQWFYGNNAGSTCTATGRYMAGNQRQSCHTNHFYSNHPNGANWLLGDGSVRFIPYSAQPYVSGGLATRAGNEVVPGDF
jgi:prepilin-type processing-associated H-X9-DG protein